MWVPLHVHSQYSILDASASTKEIAQKAAEIGMSAVALTDHGNMFGTAMPKTTPMQSNLCLIYLITHSI